ncbi:MAG: glycoside hydrolase family 20 zincin-like fold domain-containing protein [Ignavibacteria bacterium]|jgi:hypothetical protein
MILGKKRLIGILVLPLLLCGIRKADDKLLNVIPYPQKVEYNYSQFKLDNELSYQLFSNDTNYILLAIRELGSTIAKSHNITLNENGKSAGKIILGVKGNDSGFDKICTDNNLLPLNKNEEGYKLLIKDDSIIIASVSNKGLFYGIQTLKQIVRSNAKQDHLAGVEIEDWPDFKYRAVSDDISRGPIPTLDFMKYQVRRFAEMKINTVVHYVEHVVKTKSHTEFAPDDGSLTIEEWKEISEYAEKYNITVIGGFQSFGHFQRILETPEYAHLGEEGSLISPVLEESYEFLEDIYSEMIPAFNSPIFNINCDETFDLGKGRSKALVDSIGYDGVYYQHIMKLYNIVKRYDKQILMWGDILLEYPVLLDKLPKDIIIGTWNYDSLDNFDKFIKPFKEKGFEFWVVPGVLNSNKLFPNYYAAPINIRNFTRDGFKYGASGVLNCVWDDGGSTLFTNIWYGVSFGADKSWNTKAPDYEKFDSRFNRSIYCSYDMFLTKTIQKLNELSALEPTDANNDKVLFAKLLPESGKTLRISLDDWDKVLNIVNEAEVLLNSAELKKHASDKTYLQFVINMYRTLALERMGLIKAAEYYAEAESTFKIQPFKSRELILSSIEIIDGIIQGQYNLKNDFELLWLKENHTYALDWTTDRYESKTNEFIDVKKRLFASLKRLDSSLPILSSQDVRLAISKLPGKYFREWMMINPVAIKGEDNLLETDYLQDMGGEENAVPKVTQEFYYDNKKYRWRRVVTEYPDIVNLGEIFPDHNANAVMYAFANISLEKDTTIKAFAGFDEGMEVFINGKSVFKKTGDDKFEPDEYSFSFDLPKGKNNMLIKLIQTTGEWGFTFRLPESEVRNSKNRYRIVE